MSFVYALIDDDGDYVDYAFVDEDQAESAAIRLQTDATRDGIDCRIEVRLVRAKNLPISVEVI